MSVKNSITWYIARNHEGRFSAGECNDGDTCWTNELVDARFHEKIGPVKAAVTKFVKHNPQAPIPEILEWTIDIATAKVIDVGRETQKRIDKNKRTKATQEKRDRTERLQRIAMEEARLADERKRLEGKI